MQLLRNPSVAIIVLTDENDASIKESSQYWYVAETDEFHLPRARKECLTNPGDPCCLSCGQAQGSCPDDPGCAKGLLSDAEDPVDLREWHSKQRFGIEFYYEPSRYIAGLTQFTVADRTGAVTSNPIYASNPSTPKACIRDPSLVFLTEIVGVPWQDIARRNASGKPDLTGGLDRNGKAVGGFKSWDELTALDAAGHSAWDLVLGDFDHYGNPLDPLMIESVLPRAGTNPATGSSLAPVGSPNGTNPINGHERDTHGSEIQYACIFDLSTRRPRAAGRVPSRP